MIDYTCPTCGQPHTAPPTAAGAKHECTGCGQRVEVPAVPKRSKDVPKTTAHPPLSKTRLGQLSGTEAVDPIVLPDEPERRKRRRRRAKGFACPRCGEHIDEVIYVKQVSMTGIVVMIVMLFVFFPLFFVGFFLQDTWTACPHCRKRLSQA